MPRDRANIRTDIWGSSDWRGLTAGAQHLYLMLLTHPTLSYCGVADWRPGRLAALARGSTVESTVERAAELSAAFFIVVDTDTEEVLIRSFIKHDGLMRQPKLAVSMANAFAGTASEKLRNVIAFEVKKYQSHHPGLSCWSDDRVQTVLNSEARSASDFDTTVTPPVTPPVTPGFTPTVTPGFTPPDGQALGAGLSLPTTTATTTSPKGDRGASRARRIPDGFSVTDEMRTWAAQNTPSVNVDDATSRFVDYWRSESGARARKLDWVATWRNWLRRDASSSRPAKSSAHLESIRREEINEAQRGQENLGFGELFGASRAVGG